MLRADVDDELMIDECLTLLFAAHDTTSNTMAWCMYLLAEHADAQALLQQEVDEVLGAAHGGVTDATLPKLRFTRAVLNETLRLHGPVNILDREVTRDVTLCGVRLPKGTTVGFSLEAASRSADFWNAPEQFKPQRWLGGAATGDGTDDDGGHANDGVQRHAYAFTPFSANSRNCIGSRFSLQEQVVLLAHVMRRFTVSRDASSPVLATFVGTIEPKGLMVKYTPRKAAK